MGRVGTTLDRASLDRGATPTRPPRQAGAPPELDELQRAAGNRAVGDALAGGVGSAVLRQAAPGLGAERSVVGRHGSAVLRRPAPAGGAAPAQAPAPPVDVAARIVAAAGPLIGTAGAHTLMDVVSTQLSRRRASTRAPRHRATDPMHPVYTELYAADVVAALRRMGQRARTSLLTTILDRLMPGSGERDPVAVPAQPGDNATAAATEQTLVSARVLRNCEGGWPSVRRSLLATFGALEIGPRAAITRINAYFDQLVESSLLGRNGSLVHPILQARLARATAHLSTLTVAERDSIISAMRTPGGFNIRPNRNRPLVLSNHAFGWAIDLAPSKNPNIGKSNALAAVADVTGVNPLTASTGGKTAADATAVATRLRDASSEYVAVMGDPARFTAAVRSKVDTVRVAQGMPALTDAQATALGESLQGRPAPDRAAVLSAAFPTPVADRAATTARGATADALLRMAQAWRESHPRSGRRPAATTEASVGSVAAHGFLDLPGRLVGALTGSDAGGLSWLGTASVHDYMHFELASADRPALF